MEKPGKHRLWKKKCLLNLLAYAYQTSTAETDK